MAHTYYISIYILSHVEKLCIYFPVFLRVRKRKTKEKEREKVGENSCINLFICPSKQRVNYSLDILGTSYEWVLSSLPVSLGPSSLFCFY